MTKKEFLKTISAMGFRYDDEENTWITHPDCRGTVGVANFSDCLCQCLIMPSFNDFVEDVELGRKPMLTLSPDIADIVLYHQAVERFEKLLVLMKQYRKRFRLKNIKEL